MHFLLGDKLLLVISTLPQLHDIDFYLQLVIAKKKIKIYLDDTEGM